MGRTYTGWKADQKKAEDQQHNAKKSRNEAEYHRRQAVKQADITDANRIAALSLSLEDGNPIERMLLAIHALRDLQAHPVR